MLLRPLLTAEEIERLKNTPGWDVFYRRMIIARIKESIEDVYDERVKDILETLLHLIEEHCK